MAGPTTTQIKRAKEVLSRSILPTQINKLPADKLNSLMQEVTYQDLRPRDILQLTEDVKNIYHRSGKALIDNLNEGFSSSTAGNFLHKGEIIRIIQKFSSNDVDFKNKGDFSGIQGSSIDVAEFTVIKLDQNLEPIGEILFLLARGGLDRKVTSVKRFEGGFMSRNPSLSFSRAGLGDVVMNAQKVKSGKSTLPAFTPAIITKIVRTRMNWTISNYNYVATLFLLNCPEEFRAQKCEVQINGIKSYPDPIWAHYTMPENRRELKFWGMSLMY